MNLADTISQGARHWCFIRIRRRWVFLQRV